MGDALEIIYDMGGGIPNDKKFEPSNRGPSGNCIPEACWIFPWF